MCDLLNWHLSEDLGEMKTPLMVLQYLIKNLQILENLTAQSEWFDLENPFWYVHFFRFLHKENAHLFGKVNAAPLNNKFQHWICCLTELPNLVKWKLGRASINLWAHHRPPHNNIFGAAALSLSRIFCNLLIHIFIYI